MVKKLRDYYEVLGVTKDATDEELRSQYKKLSIVFHPDKNRGNEEEANEKFKELSNAYTVLKDKKERKWYDDHKNSILRGEEEDKDGGPDLWKYFSTSCYSSFDDNDESGFYNVYAEAFGEIWETEMDEMDEKAGKKNAPPPFGSSKSAPAVVTEFYSYWEGFTSVRRFGFAEKYNPNTADSRYEKRAIEKENEKERSKARKEYNDLVKSLVAFVKKRDKRVITMEIERRKKEQELEEQRAKEKAEKSRKAAEIMEKERQNYYANINEDEVRELEEAIAISEEYYRTSKKKKKNKNAVPSDEEKAEEEEAQNIEEGNEEPANLQGLSKKARQKLKKKSKQLAKDLPTSPTTTSSAAPSDSPTPATPATPANEGETANDSDGGNDDVVSPAPAPKTAKGKKAPPKPAPKIIAKDSDDDDDDDDDIQVSANPYGALQKKNKQAKKKAKKQQKKLQQLDDEEED